MSSFNYFELLNYDSGSGSGSDENSDVEIEVEVKNKSTISDTKRHLRNKTVNSEFLNSESSNNKKIFKKKRVMRSKYHPVQDDKKVLRVKRFQQNPVYNEMDNLPTSLYDAVRTKQNLTLKQILVLMNLHAMPGMVVNLIHDKVQQQVHKMLVKISHDGRVFYVSQYHWYDLIKIEKFINTMLDTY